MKSLVKSYIIATFPRYSYRIMQIIRGGKVSWLHDLLVIHGKTFKIAQQFKTPYNKKEKIRWKTFMIGG